MVSDLVCLSFSLGLCELIVSALKSSSWSAWRSNLLLCLISWLRYSPFMLWSTSRMRIRGVSRSSRRCWPNSLRLCKLLSWKISMSELHVKLAAIFKLVLQKLFKLILMCSYLLLWTNCPLWFFIWSRTSWIEAFNSFKLWRLDLFLSALINKVSWHLVHILRQLLFNLQILLNLLCVLILEEVLHVVANGVF